jgi:hypothetical protein
MGDNTFKQFRGFIEILYIHIVYNMSFTLDSPIEMTEKFEYVSIEYSVDELVLDSHVRIRVVFVGTKGKHQVKYAVIKDGAYDSWGSEDSVILDLLLANIISLGECDRELVIAFPIVRPRADAVVDISGIDVDVSGDVIDVSGSVVDVSGSVVDVSGSVVDVSGGEVDVSGSVVE